MWPIIVSDVGRRISGSASSSRGGANAMGVTPQVPAQQTPLERDDFVLARKQTCRASTVWDRPPRSDGLSSL